MPYPVSLLDFLCTGEFPPLRRGMTSDVVIETLGEPDHRCYCDGPNGEPTTWTYEKLGVYLNPNDLCVSHYGMVFFDSSPKRPVLPWTGKLFEVDPWIITAETSFSDLKSAFTDKQLTFREGIPEPPTDRYVELPAGVTLWFAPRVDGELRLNFLFSYGQVA